MNVIGERIKIFFFIATFSLLLLLPMKTVIDNIAFGLIVLLGAYLIYQQNDPIKFNISSILILIFGVILYSSSVCETNSFSFLKEHRDMAKIILLFLIYKHIVLTRKDVLLCIVIPLGISSWMLFFVGMYKFYFFHDYVRFHLFTNINRSSIYALLALSILLPFTFEVKRYHYLMLFTIFIILATIIMLGSRTAIVLAFLVLSCYFLLLDRTIPLKKIIILVAGMTLCVLIIFYLNYDLLNNKLENITYEPYRPKIWQAGIDAYIHSKQWLLGIGTSQFDTIDLMPYNTPNLPNHIRSAHNLFIEILVENGLLGLIIYLSFLYSILKNIWNNHSKILFNIGILTFLVHIGTSMTETTLIKEHGALLLIIFALCTNSFLSLSSHEINKEKKC